MNSFTVHLTDDAGRDFHYNTYIHRVLKIAEIVKTMEVQAVDAVRDLLEDVPGVEVDSIEYERTVGRDYGVDGVIGIRYAGTRYALVAKRHLRLFQYNPAFSF